MKKGAILSSIGVLFLAIFCGVFISRKPPSFAKPTEGRPALSRGEREKRWQRGGEWGSI